jgi:hypothetical protein
LFRRSGRAAFHDALLRETGHGQDFAGKNSSLNPENANFWNAIY